ncbi:MAG: glucosidase, partial [Acidimicrobiales bacterium]
MVTVEHDRIEEFGLLDEGLRAASPWYWWGPYLSERQWGTVREDYSADGNAWDYLPHEAARSTAYRWGEDGLAGFCDVEQRLCLGLALWNGRDRILKERIFGVTQSEANHGEDAKEYWWYNDALPSHAWNVWRYHYPQGAFPYEELVAVGRARSQEEPEYELLDTGTFDEDRYWAVEVRYAKADPTDLLIEIDVTNAGPDPDTIHVLPTAWFRNTWSWEFD